MADYSYVKVDFSLPTPEEAEDFAWKHLTGKPGDHKLTFPHYQGGEATLPVIPSGSSGVFEVYIEEARYGFRRDEAVVSLCRWLIRLGIPWSAYDEGAYGWPETQYEWDPGDGKRVYSRPLSRGQPVLTRAVWRRALDLSDGDPDSMVRLIDAHFGSDHHGWIQTEIPVEAGAT